MAKIWENRASLSNHNISQNLHRYSLCMGYPAGELLVLGLELLFQALCHSSTVLEVFKGPKTYAIILKRYILNVPFQQYNVPFLFYCVMQINGLTLEFKVHASKRRLRWEKKNNMRHVHQILHPLRRGRGGGGGLRVGYMWAVSPFDTFLKVYFGPINFYDYF